MKPLNEIAAWVFGEIAHTREELTQAAPKQKERLADSIVLLHRFLKQLKIAGQREEQRKKQKLRGFWNRHDVGDVERLAE